MTKQVLSSPQAQTRPPFGAVLRYPSFVVLWSSEALSLIGDRLIMVALVILVYDRTGSAGAVGLLMLLKAVPALVLGSVAGVFVDRWNRQWIMVGANLLQGLLVFWLPFSPDITLIFIIYLLMAIINQFFVPARSATIPDLVPPETLMTANSLFAISFVGSMAIGPAIGAWVIGRFGLNAAFYIDAVTFLIPALAVSFLAIPRQRRSPIKRSVSQDLRAGLAFARSRPVVLAALATITTAFLVIGTISVAGVVVTRQVLKAQTSQYGMLMSSLGVGMLIGAFGASRLGRRFNRTRLAVAGTGLMALGVTALPWSPNMALAGLCAAIMGVGMLIVQVSGQTILQTISPEMRGRLMGISQTLTGSATFLASALVGLLVERLNVTLVMGGMGALALSIAVAVAIYYRNAPK